jgi:SAM-dependent methyltransferase
MASVTRYHDYLWSFVEPSLGRRVIEVGVGFGQYTRRILESGRQVLGCDLDPGHLRDLRALLPVGGLQLQVLDLEAPEPARAACADFKADTVVLLNVLEHIGTDRAALAFLSGVAAPRARLVLIVPAGPALHNALDREAGHHRRYSPRSLQRVLGEGGWRCQELRYFNLPGIAGWIVAGWLSRWSNRQNALNAPSTNWLLRFYDRFCIGLARLCDPWACRISGLSLVAVAVKDD